MEGTIKQSQKVRRANIPVKKGPFKYDSCRILGEFSLKMPESGRILKKTLVSCIFLPPAHK
jgi:hypothetical protein